MAFDLYVYPNADSEAIRVGTLDKDFDHSSSWLPGRKFTFRQSKNPDPVDADKFDYIDHLEAIQTHTLEEIESATLNCGVEQTLGALRTIGVLKTFLGERLEKLI